jgi:hypothetical protein
MKENKKNNNHFYNKREGIDGIDDADVPPLVYEKNKRNLSPSYQKGLKHLKVYADFVAR